MMGEPSRMTSLVRQPGQQTAMKDDDGSRLADYYLPSQDSTSLTHHSRSTRLKASRRNRTAAPNNCSQAITQKLRSCVQDAKQVVKLCTEGESYAFALSCQFSSLTSVPGAVLARFGPDSDSDTSEQSEGLLLNVRPIANKKFPDSVNCITLSFR